MREAQQNLYPRMDTVEQVRQHAASQLPIYKPNELTALLELYHNTLKWEQAQGKPETIH